MTPGREDLPFRPCVGVVVFNDEGKVWAGRRIQDSETPIDTRDAVWMTEREVEEKRNKTLLNQGLKLGIIMVVVIVLMYLLTQ